MYYAYKALTSIALTSELRAMPESPATLVHRYKPTPAGAADADPFDKLKELVASGYLPSGAARDDRGILLQMNGAPDLILFPDGRIDVPLGQPIKRPFGRFRWRSWLRILALIVLGGVFWMASLGVSLSILEWMEGF